MPPGFLQKVGDRGKIVEGWAPQARILDHSSIGGFVSHCGWNSVTESMHFGVPITAIPMHLDQPINARLVKEFRTGIEVLRDKDGRLEREGIASVIEQVVFKKNGRYVRKKTKKLCANMRRKGDEEINEVVRELVQLVSS